MKGQTVDNSHFDGIIDFVWNYVKSETPAELRHNRQRLLDSVFEAEKMYLHEHCISCAVDLGAKFLGVDLFTQFP